MNLTHSQKPVMVTVICLSYNHEHYIRQCLDGFVMQKTSFPFDVIVHDDASKDNSQLIIREYVAKYPDIFKPIFQSENQYSKGQKARVEMWKNVFRNAQGKYVALCEGDDYWTAPDKLQLQVDFLEAHPDYGMCFHDADFYDETAKAVMFLQKTSSWEVATSVLPIRFACASRFVTLLPKWSSSSMWETILYRCISAWYQRCATWHFR